MYGTVTKIGGTSPRSTYNSRQTFYFNHHAIL